MAAYKYRHREEYKGVKMDLRANSLNELVEKVKKKKESIDANLVDGNMLLSAFGDRYLQTYRKPTVSAEWYEDLEIMLKRHVVKRIGDKRIKDVALIEVQQMLNSLDNFSDEYIGKIYNLTCQIFHSAFRNNVLSSDFSEDLIKPKGKPAKKGKRLTDAEQSAMLKVIQGHKAETLCLVMYYCGLRTIEARHLQWFDIDWEKMTVHVRGTKTVNADRIVPLPDAAADRLRGFYKGNPFDYVCIHDKQQSERAWRNVVRLMNIEMGCKVYRNKLQPPFPVQDGLRLYDLRHTYCTNLELAGVSLSIASRLMGHSDIRITAAIYTHGTDESIDIARALINGKSQGRGQECGQKLRKA